MVPWKLPLLLRINGLYSWFQTPGEKKKVVTQVQLDSQGVPQKVEVEEGHSLATLQLHRLGDGVYLLLVLALLSWGFIHDLVQAIDEKEVKYISSKIHTLLVLSQLFLGRRYFRKKHLYQTIKENAKWIPDYQQLIIFLGVSSFLVALVSMILLVSGARVITYQGVYEAANSGERVLISLLIFLEKFIDNNIFLSTSLAFLLVFRSIGKKMGNLTAEFEEHVKDPEKANKPALVQEYGAIKAEYGEAVGEFNAIFASMNVLGSLSFLFTLINHRSRFIGAVEYINLGFLVLIIGIYLQTVSQMTDAIDDLKKLGKSPATMQQLVNRSPLQATDGDLESSEDLKIDLRMGIRVTENSEILDWLVMEKIFDSEWEAFRVLGYDVQNTEIIQQGIAIGVALILGWEVVHSFGFSLSE